MDPETTSSSKSEAGKKTSPDQDQSIIATEPTQSTSSWAPSQPPAEQEPTILPTTHLDVTDEETQEQKKLWAKVVVTVLLVVRFIIIAILCGFHGHAIADDIAIGGDSSYITVTLFTIRIGSRVAVFVLLLAVELPGLWARWHRLCLRITSLIFLSIAALATLGFIVFFTYWCITENIVGSELKEWIRVLVLDGINVVAIIVEIVAFSVLVHSPRHKA